VFAPIALQLKLVAVAFLPIATALEPLADVPSPIATAFVPVALGAVGLTGFSAYNSRTGGISSAVADTYTTAEPVRFSREPVELSSSVRLRVVPVAV
jgi:hypothetical protein